MPKVTSFDEQFIVAARDEPLAKVEAMFRQGVNLNATNKSGRRALYEAAKYNPDRSVARFLIDMGADPLALTRFGDQVMHAFASRGEVDMLRSLSDAGVGIDIANKMGWTPLFSAVRNGHVVAVEFLLERGAKANKKDKEGKAPLHLAFSVPVIDALLRHKADINAATHKGHTPLHERVAFTDLLKTEVYPFMETVKHLIASGADIHAKAKDGSTPVLAAAKNKKPFLDVMLCLLEAGCDPGVADNRGSTVMSLGKTRPMLKQALAAFKARSAVNSVLSKAARGAAPATS